MTAPSASPHPALLPVSPAAGPQPAPAAPGLPTDPRSNRLLASLPAEDLKAWLPRLEPVFLPIGHVLYESGAMLSHGWFPTTAIVSLMYVTENGGSVEVAVVGHEGMVGIPLFMGGGSTPSRAVVRSAGHALRIAGPAVRDAFGRSAAVMSVLLRYTQALIAQMAQIAACNRHHALDQQLCRWLLLSLDRLHGADIAVTHDVISQMLGVRREGVTAAASALQRAGPISYRRGHILVLDRQGLEHRSCECYAVIKAEYDRLLVGTG